MRSVKWWDLEGHLLVDRKWHTGMVTIAVVWPDGKPIITASADGTVITWYTR